MGLTENNMYKEKFQQKMEVGEKMQGNDFSRFPGRNRSGHVPLNFPFFSPFSSL